MSEQRVAEHSVLMDVDEALAGPRRPKRPVEKTFRRYDQGQPMLLAPDIRDWLAAEHPARWVDALVEEGLDLSPIYDDYTEVRGGPPYDPRLMVKVLIYGYSHGITSSRALERRCHDDVAYGFLTAQQAPDFVAISRFRTRHAEAFRKLFTQSLALCAQGGCPKSPGTWVAIRGELYAATPTVSWVSAVVSGWAWRCRAVTSWGICL